MTDFVSTYETSLARTSDLLFEILGPPGTVSTDRSLLWFAVARALDPRGEPDIVLRRALVPSFDFPLPEGAPELFLCIADPTLGAICSVAPRAVPFIGHPGLAQLLGDLRMDQVAQSRPWAAPSTPFAHPWLLGLRSWVASSGADAALSRLRAYESWAAVSHARKGTEEFSFEDLFATALGRHLDTLGEIVDILHEIADKGATPSNVDELAAVRDSLYLNMVKEQGAVRSLFFCLGRNSVGRGASGPLVDTLEHRLKKENAGTRQ